jgi:hypothetical protein
VKDGEFTLASYLKSLSSAQPLYSELKNAKDRANQALLVFSGFSEAVDLRDRVRQQIFTIIKSGQDEVQLYRQALTSHAPGYSHLVSARALSDAAIQVDPKLQDALSLKSEVAKETGPVESAVESAQAALSAGQIDKATGSIHPYRSFSAEEPKIAALIDSIYKYHMEMGAASASTSDWQKAAIEYEKAGDTRNTPEASDALLHARDELLNAQNKAAAGAALQSSKTLRTNMTSFKPTKY